MKQSKRVVVQVRERWDTMPRIESSYLDMLQKLKANVEHDIIPYHEREYILGLISELEGKLWKYSN
jgi:hypothetical protein